MADESEARAAAQPLGRPLELDDLVEYFRGGAKPRSAFRVGVEQEKLAARPDGGVVPYEGASGIEALLGAIARRGFAPIVDRGHSIGLSRGGDRITVEPGGQVELSGAALPTAAACAVGLRAHVAEVREVGATLGMRFL